MGHFPEFSFANNACPAVGAPDLASVARTVFGIVLAESPVGFFGIMLCYSIIEHNDFEGHYANCIIRLAFHYASHLGSFIGNDLLMRSIRDRQKSCEVNDAVARRGDVL